LLGAVLIVAAAVVVGSLAACAAGPPDDAEYIGTGKCRLCHLKDHKTWKKTKHATAFDALVDAERADPECVRCHTTGYGRPGGYVDEKTTPKLKNVGCESCHGPGSAHVAAAKKKPKGDWDKNIDKTPVNKCIQCHVTHVRHGEAAETLRNGG